MVGNSLPAKTKWHRSVNSPVSLFCQVRDVRCDELTWEQLWWCCRLSGSSQQLRRRSAAPGASPGRTLWCPAPPCCPLCLQTCLQGGNTIINICSRGKLQQIYPQKSKYNRIQCEVYSGWMCVCSLTQSIVGLVLLVCSSQLSHQVGAVVAGVVSDDGRQLDEKMTRKISSPRIRTWDWTDRCALS